MADVVTKPKKIQRLQIGLNLLIQLILIFFLVSAVNWLGFRHYKRWDVSRDQKYALSDKTKRFLNSIKGKVRITVFFSPNTPISGDVASLLTEYQYAAKGKIDIENIDPQRNLSRAKEMFDKYKVVSEERFIEIENIKFQELNLFNEPQIPAEIKTVMITGPQYDLSDREIKLLHDFWNKQGRILLLIDPSAKTPKLNAFLNELGVKVNDDRLMAFVRTGIEELALIRDVQARFVAESPVTKRLANVRALFFGGTSSIALEPDRVRAANIRLQPLIETEKGYFAETDYNTTDQAKLQADAKKAGTAPLTIGVSIEKGGSADERVQMNSSRMVVVSNATFIQDNALTQDQQALDFISASANWLLSREQLIGIAPKVPKTLTFSLNEDALRSLRWTILIFMPLIFVVLGTAVWWKRRA